MNEEISICKKCKKEPVLKKSPTGLTIKVECPCGNESSYECFTYQAIDDWNRKNK